MFSRKCLLSVKCLHAFRRFVANVSCGFDNLSEMNLGVVTFVVVLHHVVRVCDTYCCDVSNSMSVITGGDNQKREIQHSFFFSSKNHKKNRRRDTLITAQAMTVSVHRNCLLGPCFFSVIPPV